MAFKLVVLVPGVALAVIHYRLCSRHQPTINSPTLRDAVVAVMDRPVGDGKTIRRSISARRQRCPDDHDVVLNVYTQNDEWVFAEFLRAEPGALLVTVREDANDEMLQIGQYPAPEGNSPHRGSLYALIYGDHVLYASKGSFSSKCLEDYLTWFFQKSAAVLPMDRRLVLATRTPSVDRLRANSVRLRLNPLERAQAMAADASLPEREERLPASQSILNTLAVTDADLRRMIEGGELEVDVVLKFKDGRRSRDIGVGDLNQVFRNVEDAEDVSYDGPDGPIGVLGARLRGRQNIEMFGSVYDASDARRKLLEQFDDWRQQGHIRDNVG